MSAPAPEATSRPLPPEPAASALGSASKAPPALLLTAATIGGAALLLISGVIHLIRWSVGPPGMGWPAALLIFLGIMGSLLAAGIVRFGHPGAVLSGALYLALTTALLVLGGEIGLAGYEQSLPAPYAQLVFPVQVGGFALLAAAAWLMLSPSPGGRTKEARGSTAADDESEEPVMEPASLSPLDLSNAQMIRWPADRPHRVMVGAEPARTKRPAAEPLSGPVVWPAPAEPVAGPAAPEPAVTPPEAPPGPAGAQPAVAVPPAEPSADQSTAGVPAEAGRSPEPADEREPQEAMDYQATSELDVASEQIEAGATASGPATELVEEPAEQLEEPDQVEEADQVPAELELLQDPVPESFPEPVRSLLVREREILNSLIRARGIDDPSVLNSRGNIAYYYFSAGDVRRAYGLQEGIAADSARILGEDHPHTVTARSKLGQWRKLAKKSRRAKASV
ncbi:MAG TPA: hypothetical protein VM754_11555 [Actinomycetota bacterium]|nr:hypothetical protein [Actinomycetota bacterium]